MCHDKKVFLYFQLENELNTLDLPNCSNEPLHNHPLTSFSKHITKLEATFTCTGGDFFGQGNGSWFLLHLRFLSLRQTYN